MARCGESLIYRNGDAGDLRAWHAAEMEEMGGCVDYGYVHRDPDFCRFGFGCGYGELCAGEREIFGGGCEFRHCARAEGTKSEVRDKEDMR